MVVHNLKERREAKGLSMEKLARLVGCSFKTIQNAEKDKNIMDVYGEKIEEILNK